MTVSAVCFVGPTLSVADAMSELEAVYLPPVSQGDVLAAVETHRPRVMGIIDGYFDQVPAVGRKEILWALSQGIHVFGSASMGALRAAELHTFGMIGVGRIFEWYRDGVLDDDDEVAVVHGPGSDGYPLLSEAMANIRASIPSETALLAYAKSLYYPDRNWETLEAHAARPLPRVNLKRHDAIEMLGAMRRFLQADPAPLQVSWEFHATLWWDALVKSKTSRPLTSLPTGVRLLTSY